MALIIALGVMLALGVAGTTVIYSTSTNTRSAAQSKAKGAAFQLAEAGLHESLSVLSNQPTNDPASPTLLATRTSTYSTGSVTWGGTYDSATAKWTITSTGKVPNPTGASIADSTRTITAKVPIRPVTSQSNQALAWNYVFSYGTGDPSGCDMTTASGVVLKTRVLVSGNLCLSGSSSVQGTNAQLLVGGLVNQLSPNNFVGQSGTPIDRVDAAGGCKVQALPVHSPCQGPPGNADRVWANTITTTPAVQPAPNPDWAYWYTKASPGPTNNCTGANRTGTPPTFDTDTTRNRSAPDATLTPNASYTCRTYLGAELRGELSWNNTTKALTVHGTIFIDGNAQITQESSYTGQATLYLTGSFLMPSSAKMCSVKAASSTACNFASGAWDPNARLLAVVTGGAGGFSGTVPSDTTVMLASGVQWQGAIYGGPYRARVASSVMFAGPLIADEVMLNSSAEANGFTSISSAPTGLPGNTTVYALPAKLELFSG